MESIVKDSVSRFTIPGLVEIVEGNGGLPKVKITSRACVADMYLHGAQVTSWKPFGKDEVLFLSSQSHWEEGRAIRGGVPISFPWFAHNDALPAAPDHGFVRTKAWRLDSISPSADAVTVSMSTESDASTKKWWPADFRAVLRASFGQQLVLEFEVMNTGKTAFRLEEALHAYFSVGNVEMTGVRIRDALRYIDKTDGHQIKTQRGDLVMGKETDSVYLNTVEEIEVEEPLLRRRLRIAKENSRTTVAWNPWREKAQSMADLAYEEWTHLICIEPSNVADFAVNLAPAQHHTMRVHIRVVDF